MQIVRKEFIIMPQHSSSIHTLVDLLAPHASAAIALRAPEQRDISYGALRERVIELAGCLAAWGVRRGERVAIAMANGPAMVVSFLAAATAATAAPLNPRYRAEEFAFSYEDTGAVALLVQPASVAAALAAAPPAMRLIEVIDDADGLPTFRLVRGATAAQPFTPAGADDIAMILHTSGTTSRPKRVPIRHRNLVASASNIAATYGLSPADTTLCVMPLFHIHGIAASLLASLATGGTVVCPAGFDALRFFGWIQTYRPSWYSAVPTMHQLILSRAERNQAVIRDNPLRFIRSSSAPLPPVIMERIEAVFGAPLLEAYGMTEASHQMTSNQLPPGIRRPGSVGIGVGVEVAIMDEHGALLPVGTRGEVVIRGPNVIDGYENNPEANASAFVDGWFRTGDQGVIDEAGQLTLTGRLKELINRGGEKISPLEIDDVLLRHPAVAEALAFAVPHPALGEDIHAAVVLREAATERELREHCAASLADFKVPRSIHLLEALPRGDTGKLQRMAMARLLHLSGQP
jgi:acyl-CoA synthetase (AMP-forming)/AMP-acid ligase II